MSGTFDSCLERGRELFNDLRHELSNGSHVDRDTSTEFGERYIVGRPEGSPHELFAFYGATPTAAMRDGDQGDNWFQVHCSNKADANAVVYITAVNRSGTGIACLDIGKGREPHDGSPTLPWSDCLFNTFAVFPGDSETVTKLSSIWMMNIVNARTLFVIDRCINGRYGLPFIDFVPESDEFLAILGTPNFSGILRMLRQYPTALGLKTVTCVRVIHRNLSHKYFACLHLETVPVGPRKRSKKISAAKQRRLDARQSRASEGTSENAA